MIKPILAIDFDEVLVDNHPVWDRYFAEGRCGTKHPVVYDPSDWLRYEKLCPTCWNFVLSSPEMVYSMPPRQDFMHVAPLLAKQFDLYCVTAKLPGQYEATKNWFGWQGVAPYFTGLFFERNKRKVCEDLNAIAIIDDGPGNIEAFDGSSVHPIIWDTAYNRYLDGTRVRNWFDAYAAVIDLAAGCVPNGAVA